MAGTMVNIGNSRRQRGAEAAGREAGSAADFEAAELFMTTDLVDNINTLIDLVDIVNQIP
jgi:hypothetical protein